MTPQTFEQALDAVLADMRTTMIERQRKYGPDNIRELGAFGVLQRALSDKGERLRTHYEREDLRRRCVRSGMPQAVIDEHLPATSHDHADDTLEDAHIDLANYVGPIGLMLKRGWWGLPLET